MTLQDKLNSIYEPKLPSFSKNFSKTVKEYWDDFVEPHLPPNTDVIIEWHNLIKKYVKMPDTVLGFRTGNTGGHLRRGWETVTNDGYSFFYIDNFFPHYFYKMAFDGYVPTLDEFYYSMKSKLFPLRFASRMGTPEEPWEKEYAAFNVDGKNPGIGLAGYKLAHIIDAGKNYYFNGIKLGITEICKKYFSLGKVADWRKDCSTGLYCRKNFIIPHENKAIARKLAEACFIRLIHPMNYFVSPKSKNKGKIYNIYRNGYNIAEDPYVISFIRLKFHERFKKNNIDYFQEFLDLVYSPEDFIKEEGDTVLNVIYSPTPLVELEVKDKAFIEEKNTNSINDDSTKLSKQDICSICKKHDININESNLTLAGRSGSYYPANVNYKYLNIDWWIALDDREQKKLHIFHVPATSIPRNKMKTRNDKPNYFLFYICWNNPSFLDSKSKIEFKQWLVKTISY